MSNDKLMALTTERIDTNDKLQSFVEQAKAITIPLFPETVQFTDSALKYGAAIVSVDLKVDQSGNNRDIYRNETGSYCLHLTKLNEISQQSGLQITDSRVLERRVDERGRVTYIEHQVKWKMRSVDGSIKEGTATGKYDYFRDCEKYIKPNEKDKYGNVKGEAQVKSRRAHAEALAESNALTRAYNKAIAKLPQSFTLDELKKPFLIPYVIEDTNELLKDLPTEDQIQLKKMKAAQRMGISDQIFGGPQKPPIEEAVITGIENDSSPINAAGNSEQPQQPGLTKAEENKILANEFRNATQEERTEKIMNLIKRKGWKHPAGVEVTEKMIQKADVEMQIKRIEELLNMPDAEVEVAL